MLGAENVVQLASTLVKRVVALSTDKAAHHNLYGALSSALTNYLSLRIISRAIAI